MQETAKPKQSFADLKTEKQFLKKLIADLVSRFGDSLDAIAYGWMVYGLTGSASLTATTVAVNALVSVLLSPFSAALITNWNKKRIIVACDIGRGALVSMTALLFLAGYLQPWMVIVITGLNSTLEAFRNPAGTSIFPMVVSRDKYALATSLSGALSRVFELIGMGVAGLLINVVGVSGVLLIDAGTFFLSAIILFTLKLPPHVKEAAQNAFAAFVQNTKEGFAYAAKHKIVMAICGAACMLNFALTPINALQAAYVSESLQLTAEALSVMGVAMMVGMGAGSLFVPKILEKVSRFSLMFFGVLSLSLAYSSLAFLPFIPEPGRWIALAGVFLLLGLGAAFANTVVQIAFMEKIEPAYLARTSGIMNSLCMAAMPVASFLSAALATFISVQYIFLVFGGFALASTVSFLFVKSLREL